MKDGQMHVKDGLYFRRTENGGVEIEKTIDSKEGSPVADRIVLDAGAWASIVAHVSEKGESHETFESAKRFHDGETKTLSEKIRDAQIEAGEQVVKDNLNRLGF